MKKKKYYGKPEYDFNRKIIGVQIKKNYKILVTFDALNILVGPTKVLYDIKNNRSLAGLVHSNLYNKINFTTGFIFWGEFEYILFDDDIWKNGLHL